MSLKDVSIAYMTNRKKCMWEWFVDSLWQQCNGEQLFQLIFIDYFADDMDRQQELKRIVNGRFEYTHKTPKPSVWQGKHRLTTKNYFCAANSRNTAVCYANRGQLAFVDDLSVLLPGWLDQVLHSSINRYVMAGAYKKVLELTVEEGSIKHYKEFGGGIDSRWGTGSIDGIQPCHPAHLFGCSFSVPIQAMLDVNGMDEINDGIGGEDYCLGIRLHRQQWRMFYNRNACTFESEEMHGLEAPMIRLDKRMGDTYSSNIVLNELISSKRIQARGNDFNLTELRQHILNGGEFTVPTEPTLDWRDNEPLQNM